MCLLKLISQLKTANTDLTYNVTSVKLTGISKTGTYNFADASWEAKTGEGNIKEYVYLDDSNGIEITKAGSPTDLQKNGALMLIPQSLTSANIVISYNVLKGDNVIKKVTDESISLATTGNWELEKRYAIL